MDLLEACSFIGTSHHQGKLFSCFIWFFLRLNGNLQAFLGRRICHRTQRVRQILTGGIGARIGRIWDAVTDDRASECRRKTYQSSSMCEILLSSRHEEEKKSSGLFDTADDGDGGVEGNYWFLILHPGSYPVTDPRNKTLKNYRCFCILSCIRSTNCLMLAIFFVRSKRFSSVIP